MLKTKLILFSIIILLLTVTIINYVSVPAYTYNGPGMPLVVGNTSDMVYAVGASVGNYWNLGLEPNISMIVLVDPYDFGIVSAGTTPVTGFLAFIVENKSSFSINITISGTDMIGGTTWTLGEFVGGDTPGTNIVGFKAGLVGGDYTIIVKKNAPFNILKSGLAASGMQAWGLKMYVPTVITDPVAKSGTITLTASAS